MHLPDAQSNLAFDSKHPEPHSRKLAHHHEWFDVLLPILALAIPIPSHQPTKGTMAIPCQGRHCPTCVPRYDDMGFCYHGRRGDFPAARDLVRLKTRMGLDGST